MSFLFFLASLLVTVLSYFMADSETGSQRDLEFVRFGIAVTFTIFLAIMVFVELGK